MQDNDFYIKIEKVLQKNSRYKKDAYIFLLETLNYLLDKIGETRHVSGKELSIAVKEYAHIRFGVMADDVFKYWGISLSEDIGEIVYNLIDVGLMNKNNEDKKSDFNNVCSFKNPNLAIESGKDV